MEEEKQNRYELMFVAKLLITPIRDAVNNANTIITVIHFILFFYVIHFILLFHLRMLDAESEKNCTFMGELV